MWLINKKRDCLIAFYCTANDSKGEYGNMLCEIKGKINRKILEKLTKRIEQDLNVEDVVITNIINLDKI